MSKKVKIILESKNDITGLNAKQDSLERTLDQVDGFIFQFTYNKISDKYSFTSISGGLKSIYGISAYDLKQNGRLAFQQVYEEDQPLMRTLIFESRNKLIPWKQDYRIVSQNNKIRWLRGNAIPEDMGDGLTLWNGYISEITEIKEVESKLLRSRERYEFALEGSKMGYWDWDIKNKKILYSNRSLEILGLEGKEVLSHQDTWTDLVHPDDKEEYFKDIENHSNGLTSHYSNKHRVRTTSGLYKWIHDRGKIISWDSEGRPSRATGTHIDITQVKENENAILENNGLIKKHNESLQNFALIVSHDLRNHAGNLVQILKLIDQAKSPEEKEELSSYLNLVSTGLSSTINNLDDIVSNRKKLENAPELVNLNDYIERAMSTVKNRAIEKGVTILNKVSKNIQIIYNVAYLDSILYNLISNAIKYSDPLKESSIVIMLDTSTPENILLSIADNGLGIDLEIFGTKLFGMYKTFHKNNDGQGLGLFMTKNQIDDMGDHISVESTKGIGSTFTVHFKNKLP